MPFSEQEREILLSVKGIGPTVLKRLEAIGIDNLSDLATYQVNEVTERVASMLRMACWKNNPHIKVAVKAAIQLAKESV